MSIPATASGPPPVAAPVAAPPVGADVPSGTPSDVSAAGEPEPGYRVEYRELADRRHVAVLFWLWIGFLAPYLVIRVAFINWSNALGPVAMALETLTLVLLLAANCTVRKVYVPVHRPADLSKFTVDCLIPTHREEVSLLEPTIIAALRVRGLRRVLVLGNYEREEVRELCRRLGVDYHSRGTNEYAKAGNLNNGLRHTDAEFVMVLDADHIALPHFLERLMGYFDDPGIAYAQAPQSYYNTEALLFQRSHGQPGGWTELQPFFHCDQMGKNRWEAALFIGSTAVLRRSALDQVGGFATGTPTEDIHTSLRLHTRGWRAVFTPEPLAFGLEAANLKEYYNQRRRWAAGTLNLLFLSEDSPLRARGMSLSSRVNYLYGISVHLSGLARLSFFFLPLLILFTLQNPVSVSYFFFGPIFATWFLLTMATTLVLRRGATDLRYADPYAFGSMFALVAGVKGVFVRIRHFASSRKVVTRTDSHWSKWALWALVAVSLLALVRAGYTIATSGLTAMIFWGILFTLIQGTGLGAFLYYLARFERSQRPAVHAGLRGRDKYRFVLEAYATGEIGPPRALRERPLRPEAAPRSVLPATCPLPALVPQAALRSTAARVSS